MPLSGASDVKVVDVAIQKTLRAIRDRDADVMLVSHDGDFLEELEGLLDDDRRVGVMAFREFRNSGFTALEADGLESFDLEYDVKAFTSRCRASGSSRSTSSTRRSSCRPHYRVTR